MTWFVAKLVFRIITGDGRHQPQFDEQLRLISAFGWQEALHKVKALGEREQESFRNQQEQWVHWQFVNVAELNRLGKLKDGAELHYQITEPDNAEQYMAWVNKKAANLSGTPVGLLSETFPKNC